MHGFLNDIIWLHFLMGGSNHCKGIYLFFKHHDAWTEAGHPAYNASVLLAPDNIQRRKIYKKGKKGQASCLSIVSFFFFFCMYSFSQYCLHHPHHHLHVMLSRYTCVNTLHTLYRVLCSLPASCLQKIWLRFQ